jgi:NAD(P)-dependent dehydrogenase (short-subunit alcohol dehydrogenase family)
VTRLVRQQPAGSPADVVVRLHDAFVTTQAALAEGEPVVLCVDGPALLGQASPEDSAVACGLLGLSRALAFEGGSKGWRVNVVAVDPGAEPDPALVALAASTPGLIGQVLNVSSGAVGKLAP